MFKHHQTEHRYPLLPQQQLLSMVTSYFDSPFCFAPPAFHFLIWLHVYRHLASIVDSSWYPNTFFNFFLPSECPYFVEECFISLFWSLKCWSIWRSSHLASVILSRCEYCERCECILRSVFQLWYPISPQVHFWTF